MPKCHSNRNTAPGGSFFFCSAQALERIVVVHVIKAAGGTWCWGLTGRRCGCGGAGRWRRAARGLLVATTLITIPTGTTHAFTPAQQLQFGGNNVYGVLFHPGLVGVLAVLQAAFHVDGAAFFHIFASDLGQTVIKGHAVP